MANRCDICDKKDQVGLQSRHRKGVAGKQWAKRAQKTVRIFSANIQKATVDGVALKLCAKCIKKIKTSKAAFLADKEEAKKLSVSPVIV